MQVKKKKPGCMLVGMACFWIFMLVFQFYFLSLPSSRGPSSRVELCYVLGRYDDLDCYAHPGWSSEIRVILETSFPYKIANRQAVNNLLGDYLIQSSQSSHGYINKYAIKRTMFEECTWYAKFYFGPEGVLLGISMNSACDL